jgi:hypothetical protein
MRLALVGRRHEDLVGVVAAGRARAADGHAAVGEIRALIHVEVEVDRVQRYDVGQHRLVRVDQVALGHQPARDAAADRSLDLRELEFEPRLLQGGSRAIQLGAGGLVILAPLIEKLLGDVPAAAQGFRPFEVVGRKLQARLSRRDRGISLLNREPVGALINGEERVTYPYHGPP